MSIRHWYKLDNSAKIMPSMTNGIKTNVFRLSCTLNDEVNPVILNEALEETCIEFPLFLCSMKSGLFWHYLETSLVKPELEEEHTNPCAKMDGELLFRLTYYKRRINLEVYHVLADGTGAMEFLKFLVACYLDRRYGLNNSSSVNKSSEYAKSSDEFQKFNRDGHKIKISHAKKAYRFKFPRKDDSAHDVIEVHMSASQVKELAHKYDTTVAIYLSAILIKSIISCAKIKDLKKPIGITVPIDLRRIFPSETVRNFFYAICIQYKYVESHTLKDIISFLKEKFSSEFSKENLQELMDTYMILEKVLPIRIIPNFFKDLILSLVTGSMNTETMTFSNMGLIKMPNVYDPYIESFDGYMSSAGLHLTAMSYKDELVLSFTSHFSVNEVERTMVLMLQQEGIEDIRIISNKSSKEDNNGKM